MKSHAPSGFLPLCHFCPSKVSSLPFLFPSTKRVLSLMKAELSLPALFMLGPSLPSLGFSNSKSSMQSKAFKANSPPGVANTLPWKTAQQGPVEESKLLLLIVILAFKNSNQKYACHIFFHIFATCHIFSSSSLATGPMYWRILLNGRLPLPIGSSLWTCLQYLSICCLWGHRLRNLQDQSQSDPNN